MSEIRLTDYARNKGFKSVKEVREKVCGKYGKYDTCSVCEYWTYAKHCTLLTRVKAIKEAKHEWNKSVAIHSDTNGIGGNLSGGGSTPPASITAEEHP